MSPGEEGRRRGGAPMPPTCAPEEDGSCSICGDEGLVATVLDPGADESRGRVRLEAGERAGEERRVALDLVPRAETGDRVVVHMGFAIALVREDADARRPADGGILPGAGREGGGTSP